MVSFNKQVNIKEKTKTNSKFLPMPIITKPATTLQNKTGSWRSFKPVLNKDKCTGCLTCWVLCPDSSIKKVKLDKGFKVAINYDYCKGCGICATECPVNAISMERKGS
jgi:pyruvate ferredoxin oxidoreductase delta subunit